MDLDYHAILTRVHALPPWCDPLKRDVRDAVEIAGIRPHAALVVARSALETLAGRVLEAHTPQKARDRDLGELLKELNKGTWPPTVAAFADVVRQLGNTGAHKPDAPVGEREIRVALTQLVHVAEWSVGAINRLPTPVSDSSTELAAVAPSQSAARPDPTLKPKLLPHLCDRHEQEAQVRDAVRRHRRAGRGGPIVCVVHGEEAQCLDEFVERLRVEALPGELGLDRRREFVARILPDCPRRFPGARAFHDGLLDGLANALKLADGADKTEVARALACLASPILVQVHLQTDEWMEHGRRMFDGVLGFWDDWPDLGAGHLLLVCLAVTYRQGPGRAQGWFARRRLDRENARLRAFVAALEFPTAAGVPGVVVEELLGLTRSDVEHWARRVTDDLTLRQFCQGDALLRDVRRLFDHELGAGVGARVAMEALEGPLVRLLQGHKTG